MFVVFGLLASLVQLLILGAIVVFIVKAVSGRRGGRSSDTAPATVKRLLVFGSLYAALHVAAWGVAGLVALVSDGSGDRAERAPEPLAMTIVAAPVLFLLGRWVWRTLADPAERGAAFNIYLNLTLTTALAVVMINAIMSGDWLVGDGDFSSMSLASLLVWTPIGIGHWWLWRRFRSQVSNLHVYVGAIAGLGVMAGYGGALLGRIFDLLLDSGTRVQLTAETDADVASWVVAFAVGATVFGWHWVATGMREQRDVLWHSYVVLVGVLGGLIAAVVGAGISLFAILQWWLGDPESASAVRHFQDFIPALSVLVVGGIIWFYHRRVVGPLTGDRTEVQRVYDHVVAAVGLVTAMVGVVILIIGFFEAVFPNDNSMASDANTLLGAATTLAVGIPLWAQAWRRINGFLRTAPAVEAASPTRRSYLFGIIGIAGVVAAVSLITLLVTVFNGLLGEDGGQLRNDLQVPVALLFTVGAVAVYHILVLREEREDVPAVEHPKQVVLVTTSDTLAGKLHEITGARVTVLHRLDANGEAVDPETIAAAIREAAFDDLLVVPDPSGAVQVIPYRR